VKPIDPRLFRYSRSSRGFTLSSVAIALLGATLSILQSAFLAYFIVQVFVEKKTLDFLTPTLVSIGVIYLCKSLLNYISERIAAVASAAIRRELRDKLVDHLLSGKVDYKNGPAKLSLLATRGIDNLDLYFSKFIPQLFIASVVPIFVGIAITTQDFISGIVLILTVPLIPVFGMLIGRFTAGATEKKWQSLSLLSGYFLDLITGLQTLKVYGRAKYQVARLKQVNDKYRQETMKVLRISFLSSLALELIATLSVALIAVTIGLRLVDGNISLQTGLFVLILAPEVYWPIRQVATHFHAATDGVEAADQIFNILGDKEVVDKVKIQKFDFIIWSDLIVEFENRSKVKVPAGRIENKAVNLIVGPSGAGKSTLIQILLGFQENYGGDVWVKDGENSINLKDIDKQSWQKLISWMPQEPHFPVLSVLNTLQLADPKQSKDQLLETLETVGLDLSQLPQAEQTKLGTLLEQLSIGQKRKIALARALIKPAQLLILDEPTASVDKESQERIDNLIRTSAQNGQMVLVVSHRSQSLLTADSVLDFDHNVMV
jgi:ATP-binding cassette subfamily C protein CydCD